ncbi:HEAT repeat domain-containing protein [Providencia rettgeri]
MKEKIIESLVELTLRANDDIKIAAILALGDYKATIEQRNAIFRIIELSKSPNKEIAISSIKALSKLSIYF